MKNITTKDIIKIMPFDEKFKMELLNEFNFLDADRKFNIEQALWDAYDNFYELKLKENTKLAFLRVQNGEEEFDKNFHKRIAEKTEKDMQGEAVQKTEQTDLAAARGAMEKIIGEIRASKKKPDTKA